MKLQEMFEALADENRRTILNLLKKQDMAVSEILSHLEISGASLSHHLNKLKAADLVSTKRKGQTIIYSINTTVFEDFATTAAEFLKLGDSHGKRLQKK